MKKITCFLLPVFCLFLTHFAYSQAPELSGSNVVNYLENSGPVFIHPTIVLTDADSETMSEAHVDSDPFESYERTVLISNPATMGDIYGEPYVDEGWFDVFSAGNTATLAEWQQALRSVTYTNDSEDPFATIRYYTFSIIDDQGEYSNTIVVPINIIPVNDPPVRIAGAVAPLTMTEDGPSTDLGLSAVDYDTIEASQTMLFLPTQLPSAGFGSITLADGTPVGLGVSYTLSELRGMRFLPAMNASGVGAFSFAARDSGGTSNGGVDSVTETILITVNGVSDVPIISGTYCAGSTTVWGYSVDADGTLIKIFSGSTEIGTATVSQGSWTATVAALDTNEVLTATATISGGSESAPSPAVTVLEVQQWYLDADGDGYYTGSAVVACTSPGAGYTLTVLGGNDCNDSNNVIYPGANEICYNAILENCSGNLSQGCAPVVVNMNQSYNNASLPSLSTAIPAVAYTYPGATNLKYRYSITNLVTGITAPDIVQASRYVTIPVAIHSYNASYSIRVSAVINEEIVPFAGNTITVLSPAVQLVTLNSASCGATVPTLATTISANAGLKATGYTFRIRLNDGNPTPVYAYSPSATRFVGANTFAGFPLQYSSSYRVAVQFTFNDPVTGLPVESGYGAECIINTPSIPVARLASPMCNSTVTALNANISAGAAAYATAYQFRVRLFSDNGPNPAYYTTMANPSRFSSLAAFQGITLAYSTEYAVSVRYSIPDGSWSQYGQECKVTTPFFPTTSIIPSQCGTGTPITLDQQLNITPYPGNPNYRVLLEEISGEESGESEEIVVAAPNFMLNQFSIVRTGKNYNISVAIKLNGAFGDYSTACDVSTTSEGSGTEILKAKIFNLTAYPNPFAGNFMLDLKSSGESSVNIQVYDMIGRLIEQKEVRISDLGTTTIGSQYPSGVYNVVVSQGNDTETVRVIKR